MLFEETIQHYWQASTTLSAAIPPERFFTGPAFSHVLPCLLFVPERSELLAHTNRSNPWRKLKFKLELHHDSFEHGSWLALLIRRSFDRLTLNDPDEEWAYHLHLTFEENVQKSPGHWIFAQQYIAIG